MKQSCVFIQVPKIDSNNFSNNQTWVICHSSSLQSRSCDFSQLSHNTHRGNACDTPWNVFSGNGVEAVVQLGSAVLK